jgi:dynein heavy chain
MSEQLEKMSISIYNNQVPDLWNEVSYPSLMPLSEWILDFSKRLNFIKNWVENGTPNTFWISGFFFPQGFLTGVLQNYARKHQVAIDRVSFSFVVISNKDEEEEAYKNKPEDGCYVHGLYMEGARWDTDNQTITEPKLKELYFKMPIIWFKPQVDKPKQIDSNYECPVYKTLKRAGTLSTTGHSTNYVLTVDLPSKNIIEDHWIKRGVALICALKYVTS